MRQPAGAVDDDVSELVPPAGGVLEGQAATDKSALFVHLANQTDDIDAAVDADAVHALYVTAHDKFQGRAAAGQNGQLAVFRHRPVLLAGVSRQPVEEVEFLHAGRAQIVEKAGMIVGNDPPEPGQEGMAVSQVADAPAAPVLEGVVCAAVRRRRITLQHIDAPAGGAQGQCGEQTGHAGPNHQNAFRHR